MSEKRTKSDKALRQANHLEEKASRQPEQNEKKPLVHLIEDGRLQRCSVCKQPFFATESPSVSVRFARHVLAHHKPGQTSEDVNQAAARIVREATETK